MIDPSELTNSYEQILKRRNVAGLRLTAILVCLLFPLFWILDWLALPDLVQLTFALRLLGTLYGLGIWIATIRRAELVYKHASRLGISLGVLIAWLIAIMTWLDHGYESSYYAGLNLVILGCSFLFAWSLPVSIGFNALIYGFYMAPLFLGILSIHDMAVAVSNQFFLLGTILISVIAQQHRLTQERKDYFAIQEHRLQLEQAQALAATDPLTGLYNRREFSSLSVHALGHARRLKKPLCVLAIDLDHFKQINDQHGHSIGDEVLKASARLFQGSLRQDDILARIGGDEFMALLPNTDLHEAGMVAERIRLSMLSLSLTMPQFGLFATVSVGVAPLTEDIVDLEALLLRTDEALYAAKRAGRARVHIWSLDEPQGSVVQMS